MTRTLTIDTAGIPIEFAGDDVALFDALDELYSAYTCDKAADWRINVTVSRSPDTSVLDEHGIRHTLNEPDRLWVRDSDACGEIMLDERAGSIQVSADSPARAFGGFFRHFHNRVAIDNGRTLVHAAGVIRDERAYLFAGPSGAGKSTVTRILDDLGIIHDDHVIIDTAGERPTVTTLPYMGNKGFVHLESSAYPVERIFFLHQDERAFLAPISPADALARVLTLPMEWLGAGRTRESVQRTRIVMKRCRELVLGASCHEMHFTLSELPQGVTERRNE